MSTDPLSPMGPGEFSPFVLKAGTINTMLEIGRAARPLLGGARPDGDEIAHSLPVPHSSVLVRNDTGAALPALYVVKLGATLKPVSTQPHDIMRLPAFKGTTPAAQSDNFAILRESAGVNPDGTGQIATAVIRGAAVCYVNVTDITHKWAAPDPGSSAQLVSGETGPARILTPATGTGRQLCAVLIDDRGDRLVHLEADETPVDGGGGGGSQPATTFSMYSADEPTTATPVWQFTIANNYSGGNEGGALKFYPLGTAGPLAYTVDTVTDGSDATSVTNQFIVGGETSNLVVTDDGLGSSVWTYTADIWDLTNVGAIDFTGVVVTGLSSGGGIVAFATSGAFTNQASISFTSLTGYRWYKIVGQNLRSQNAMGAQLYLRTSTNNGSSYDSGGSDYNTNGGAGSEINIGNMPSNSGNHALGFELIVYDPAGTGNYKLFGLTLHDTNASATVHKNATRNATADIDALQFTASSGNFDGEIIVYAGDT